MKTKTSDQLFLEIIGSNFKTDKSKIRKRIFEAEDMGFSIEQSKTLSPWLLNYAILNRDSNNPVDKPVVYSAIRTGASMLHPDSINYLLPLLEPNHSIDTILVTIKMIGRVFEAQPPTEINKYERIAQKLYILAESFINQGYIGYYEEAITHLSVYALASMRSSYTSQIITKIQNKKELWNIKYCLHNLKDLRHMWENNFELEPVKPLQLLNESIYQMAKYIKEIT